MIDFKDILWNERFEFIVLEEHFLVSGITETL